jgi:hypothetical protein
MKLLRDFLKYIKPFFGYLLFVAGMLYIQWYILEPSIKNSYLRLDLADFEEKNYWTILLGGCIALYILILLIVLIKTRLNFSKVNPHILYKLLIPVVLIAYMLNDFMRGSVLYMNTFTTSEVYQKEFTAVTHDDDLQYVVSKSDEEKIYPMFDPKAIDDKRKEKNLTSIHDLKDGDTIQIQFAKGFLDIKYLK